MHTIQNARKSGEKRGKIKVTLRKFEIAASGKHSSKWINLKTLALHFNLYEKPFCVIRLEELFQNMSDAAQRKAGGAVMLS